jgi:hypothetical protein
MNHSISRQKLKLLAIAAIVLTVLLVALSFFGSSGNRASADAENWNQAAHSAPAGLMAQVVAEHLNPNLPVDPGRMKILNLQLPGQSQPLYLIDSRIANLAEHAHANPLCGASRCAFFGYIPANGEGFQEVWNTYLNFNLPPEVSLFESFDELRNGFPVLKTNQMQGNWIEQSHWSFNDQEYEITKTLLTPKTYE